MNHIFYIIGAYFIAINVLTFCSYGWDKHLSKSKRGSNRISERTLLLLATIGGSIGGWIAMYTFRHKTQHKKFKYGVPAILILQLIATYKIYTTWFLS